METKKKISGFILWLLGGYASASQYTFSNSTMTESYRQLVYDNPIGAALIAYTEIWGKWFYLLIIMGPYFMMYIYQGNRLGMASIWVITTLAAYEYLIAGMTQDFIFYICVVAWVTSVLMKVTSPYKPE